MSDTDTGTKATATTDDSATKAIAAARDENAKLKADNEKLAETIKKLEVEGGKGSKEAIAALKDQVEKANARIASFEKADNDRVEAAFKALPESVRAKLEKVRPSVGADGFRALVEQETIELAEAERKRASQKPPPFAAPDNRIVMGKFEDNALDPQTQHILANVFARQGAVDIARDIQVERDPKTGDGKFRMPTARWFGQLRSVASGKGRLPAQGK